MKALCIIAAVCTLAFTGCANNSNHSSAAASSRAGKTALHPYGTDVGASDPGVNQGTPDTTASASSDSR